MTNTFSIDKVGDAVKEFNIRVKDGSKTTSDAFKSLGLDATDMARQFAEGGESANQAFYTVVEQLQQIEDPLQRNTIGVQLFGTQFEDLEANVLPVLAGMKDGALNTAGALSQIAEVKYDDISSGLEGVKRSLEGVFLDTSSEMASGITGIFTDLSNNINAANGNFSLISEAIGDAVGDIAEVIVSQMPQFVTLGMDIVTSIVKALLNNLPVLINSGVSVVMTLLGGLIAALPQITSGALRLVTMLAQGIVENLPLIIETAIGIVTTLVQGIAEALPELVPAALDAVLTLVETLTENLPQIIDAAVKIVLAIVKGIADTLPELVPAAVDAVLTLVMGLLDNLPMIIQAAIDLVMGLVKGVINALPRILEAAPQVVQALVDGIVDAFPLLVDAAIDILLEIGKALIDNLPLLIGAAVAILAGLLDSIVDNFGEIWTFVTDLFDEFVEAVASINWGELGSNIISGIVKGIKNAASSVATAVKNAVSGGSDAVKDDQEMHSPAEKPRREIGLQYGAGIALGIEDAVDQVNQAMRSLQSSMNIGAMNLSVNPAGVPAYAAGVLQSPANAMSFTFNINGSISSRDDAEHMARLMGGLVADRLRAVGA